MKVFKLVFTAFILTISFIYCTQEQAAPKPDTSCTNNGQDIMSFTQDIIPILNTYCTRDTLGDCHQASSTYGYDFTTYAGLEVYLPDVFYSFVLDPATATMPKSITNGPQLLTSCDKEKLQLWLDQGYQNN